MCIISVSGKINSGKDTVAEIIKDLSIEKNWEVKKWAGKLKEVASILTGISKEKFEDQEFKKTKLNSEWDKPIYFRGEFIGTEPMKVRDFLQLLGTDAIRNGLHSDTWVNALMSEYKTINLPGMTVINKMYDVEPEKFWIITDTRFPNELAAAKQHNAITIKVIRNSNNTIGLAHSSETSLDHITDWDYVIENNGTLEDLRNMVYDILQTEQII
jgi:lambda repressor-like predicted transcriptional regulator